MFRDELLGRRRAGGPVGQGWSLPTLRARGLRVLQPNHSTTQPFRPLSPAAGGQVLGRGLTSLRGTSEQAERHGADSSSSGGQLNQETEGADQEVLLRDDPYLSPKVNSYLRAWMTLTVWDFQEAFYDVRSKLGLTSSEAATAFLRCIDPAGLELEGAVPSSLQWQAHRAATPE